MIHRSRGFGNCGLGAMMWLGLVQLTALLAAPTISAIYGACPFPADRRVKSMAIAATNEKLHRRIINAWCMYDWANSAFATTIMAALLPPYFSNVAAADLPKVRASSIWGYSVSIAMLLVALMGPILGAIADHTGSKKRFMRAFLVVAVLFTGLLFFIKEGDWLGAVIFYVLASIGNAGANIFYDSLLPHVARPDEIDQVSTRGFAFGYLGGGLLLLSTCSGT